MITIEYMRLSICLLHILLFIRAPAAEEHRLLDCVDPICGQHTSFYNKQTDLIEIFVSKPLVEAELQSGTRMCVIVNDDPAKHCYADEHGRVLVDLSSSKNQALGTLNSDFADNVINIRRSLLLPNGSFVYDQDVESHFIVAIAKDDTLHKKSVHPSLLAYTKSHYPKFGSIVSRNLVLNYEANEIAKKEAPYVYFHIDGVHETRVDVSGSTLMTNKNNHTSNINGASNRAREENDFIQGEHVEPSSWFYKIQPALNSNFLKSGGLSYPSFGYLEWVLERHIILKNRVFGHLKDPSRRLTRGDTNNCHINEDLAGTTKDGLYEGPQVVDLPVISTKDKDGESEAIRVCMWTSNNMDGQKRIWLHQVENLSRTPYSTWGRIKGHPSFRFIIFLSSESLVAPDLEDAIQAEKYRRLVEEYYQQDTDSESPLLDSLNEYEKRLLDIKLGKAGRDDSNDPRNTEVVRAPTLGAGISRDRLTESFHGQPSPLAINSSVESVLRFMKNRFRTHMRDAKVYGSSQECDVGSDKACEDTASDENDIDFIRRLDTLEPAWVREVYQRIVKLFVENRCSISVHGNLRGFNADFLITDTARYLSIPTVSELLNLFVDADTVSDVVVGPSRYSLEHESMRHLRESKQNTGKSLDKDEESCIVDNIIPLHALSTTGYTRRIENNQKGSRGRRGRRRGRKRSLSSTSDPDVALPKEVLRLIRHGVQHSNPTPTELNRFACGPLTTVISPGVNTAEFSPQTKGRSVKFPGCAPKDTNMKKLDDENANSACFIVGFVARLATEKNPGLFIQMAASILDMHRRNSDQHEQASDKKIRFLVIGDGHLKGHLVELARRIGVIHHISFVGWVSTGELPMYLRIVDVVVNLSVRAWSETFCIANIEAMSMQKPLVTFGSGGVGEYIDIDYDQEEKLCQLTKSAIATADRRKTHEICRENFDASVCGGRNITDNEEGNVSDFSVTRTAVLVHSAHPVSLAGAVMYLFYNDSIRTSIGVSGREMIEKYFRPNDQLWKYADLYGFLADSTVTKRKKILRLLTS